jgi:hypothetical protein
MRYTGEHGGGKGIHTCAGTLIGRWIIQHHLQSLLNVTIYTKHFKFIVHYG